MRFRNFLFAGAIAMLLPHTLFATEAPAGSVLDDGGTKQPPQLTSIPGGIATREVLEGQLVETLTGMASLHLQMMQLVPVDPAKPQPTLIELLKTLSKTSAAASTAGSHLGEVIGDCALSYAQTLDGDHDAPAKLYSRLKEKAVAGNLAAVHYLKKAGQWDGIVE